MQTPTQAHPPVSNPYKLMTANEMAKDMVTLSHYHLSLRNLRKPLAACTASPNISTYLYTATEPGPKYTSAAGSEGQEHFASWTRGGSRSGAGMAATTRQSARVHGGVGCEGVPGQFGHTAAECGYQR